MLVAVLVAEIAGAVALFRDEEHHLRAMRIAILAMPAVAVLLLGHVVDAQAATTTARLLALGATVAGGVAERAASAVQRRGWWGTAPAYLAILALFAVAGWPTLGLALVALYGGATLVAAVEALRRQA